jgi:hypothetical protein
MTSAASPSLCPTCTLTFHTHRSEDAKPGCECTRHGCACRMLREQKQAA